MNPLKSSNCENNDIEEKKPTSSLFIFSGVGISIKYLINANLPGNVNPLWIIGIIGNGIERLVIVGDCIKRNKFDCCIWAAMKRQVNEIPVNNNWPANDDGSGSSGTMSIGWESLPPLENI